MKIMKKLISPKSEKTILRTHPIISNTKGWYIKVVETSQSSFFGEGVDCYGRMVSKRGNNPSELQEEIEEMIIENQKVQVYL